VTSDYSLLQSVETFSGAYIIISYLMDTGEIFLAIGLKRPTETT
jgi:hypothetical protein